MSRKLQFNIADGVNLSINEEDNTSNLWTEASYNNFGVYAPVFYNGNLYLNITGSFVLPSSTTPITTPENDSTNWIILGSGSHIRDITIVEDDSTGVVTVTVTNTEGTPTVTTFRSGHQIEVNSIAQTYEPTLNLFGDYNAIVEDNENKIYSSYTHNIGAGEDLVVLGGLHGRQPSRAVKSLVDGDNIQIVSNEENNGLIISSTGGSIADASDVTILNPQDGDILVDRLITAYFDAAIGTVESGGRMVISFAKDELFTVPTNNPQIDSLSIRWETNQSADDNIFFLGGNHLDGIDLTMNFTASTITVDNIVDRVIETFDTVTFTSGISWGSSGNLTTHNFVGFGDYVALGTYSKEDTAQLTTGERAEGHFTLEDTRGDTSSTFDVGIIQFRDYVSIDMASVNITSFTDFLTEYVVRLNANSTFNSHYTASYIRFTDIRGSIQIKSNTAGTHGNRGISFFIHDRPGNGNNTADIQPYAGSFEINGGTNDHPIGQIRWTSPKVDTVISTISATGDVNFVFKQGSHTWHNEQPSSSGVGFVADTAAYDIAVNEGFEVGQFIEIQSQVTRVTTAGTPAVVTIGVPATPGTGTQRVGFGNAGSGLVGTADTMTIQTTANSGTAVFNWTIGHFAGETAPRLQERPANGLIYLSPDHTGPGTGTSWASDIAAGWNAYGITDPGVRTQDIVDINGNANFDGNVQSGTSGTYYQNSVAVAVDNVVTITASTNFTTTIVRNNVIAGGGTLNDIATNAGDIGLHIVDGIADTTVVLPVGLYYRNSLNTGWTSITTGSTILI